MYIRQFRGQTTVFKRRSAIFVKILWILCLENWVPETKALAGVCFSTRVEHHFSFCQLEVQAAGAVWPPSIPEVQVGAFLSLSPGRAPGCQE